jgi:hypothetical protein
MRRLLTHRVEPLVCAHSRASRQLRWNRQISAAKVAKLMDVGNFRVSASTSTQNCDFLGPEKARQHFVRDNWEKWEASVARCLPNRWNPLLLPGGVRPRFCPLNLRALAPQLGSNRKSLVIVGTCVNEPSRWSHTDRQPGLYCTRRSYFAPISSGGSSRSRASPLVVEAPGYCPPGPKCLFHQIIYRHSRFPGVPKIGDAPARCNRLTKW